MLIGSWTCLPAISAPKISTAVKVSTNENIDNNCEVISIAMASDNNYIYPLIVSMTSILENKNVDTKIDFHIMHPGNFYNENKTKIISLKDKYKNCNVNLIDMGDRFNDAYTVRHHITPTAYYRLALPSLLPNLDKIIWLDCDTITFKDLSEMFNINMTECYFKGFLETCKEHRKFDVDSKFDMCPGICTGVMLINLAALRENNLEEEFDKFIKVSNGKRTFNDQTVINIVCHDKINGLPAKYGLWNDFNLIKKNSHYSEKDVKEAFASPVILHVIHKPWENLRYWGSKYWLEYAEKTDYFKEIQEKYLSNSVQESKGLELNKKWQNAQIKKLRRKVAA